MRRALLLLMMMMVALFSLARGSAAATEMAAATFETVPRDLEACGPQPCFGEVPIPIVLHGTLEPFDARLGTLQAVEFGAFTGSGSASASVLIEAPGDYGFGLEYRRTLAAADGTLIAEVDWQSHATTGIHAAAPGSYLVSAGNSFSQWRPLVTESLEVFLGSSGALVYTVEFRFRRSGLDVPESERYFPADSFSGSAVGASFVVYEYLPVPEPGTAWLVGLGLGLLAHGARTREGAGQAAS